jgi:hypothetical protein
VPSPARLARLLLALRPRQRFREGTVLIVDGTLVPTRDRSIAEQSESHRYSTNHLAWSSSTPSFASSHSCCPPARTGPRPHRGSLPTGTVGGLGGFYALVLDRARAPGRQTDHRRAKLTDRQLDWLPAFGLGRR